MKIYHKGNPIKEGTVMINIDGKEIEVDAECEDMVLFLNKIGYKTRMCCQGHKGNGRPSFKIWFDNDISDEKMIELIKAIGQWKIFLPAPVDETRTLAKVNEVKHGMSGWLYKRHYFVNDKHYTQWVYESSGINVNDSILGARKDLNIMKHTIGGEDPSAHYNSERKRVQERVDAINKKYKDTGERTFSPPIKL